MQQKTCHARLARFLQIIALDRLPPLHKHRMSAKHRQGILLQAAKKEAHAASGATCEHGVWRCRICFNRKTSK